MEEYREECFTPKQWALALPVVMINLVIFIGMLLITEHIRAPFMWMASLPVMAIFTIEGGTRWIDFLHSKGMWE